MSFIRSSRYVPVLVFHYHVGIALTESRKQIDEKHAVAEIKTISGGEAFNEALLKEPPRPWYV